MPDVGYWESLFDIAEVLDRMELVQGVGRVVEFGCGYGSFSIPLARRLQSADDALLTFDIDADMVRITRDRARREDLEKITIEQSSRSGQELVAPRSVDYVMLFNILHGERPAELLDLAFGWLRPGGRVGVIHWRYDPETPRGPSMAVRPRPEELLHQMEAAGFRISAESPLDLPPYHYGILGYKP